MRVLSKQSLMTINNKTEDNIILIDKPVDWSSFDVVKKVRGIGRFKKTGHGGTLDPFASGLLILGTGRETRSLTTISSADKSYMAKITFGSSTDTYDSTGQITDNKDIRNVDIDKIKKITESFLGAAQQQPPMFSAKKVSGTRLYKLARKGISIDRKPVTVYFHELRMISHDNFDVNIYIKCSKGTYIRSFANDLGLACGYLGHLKALRRLSINNYNVKDAFSIEEFASYWRSLN
jgi:tRNA pseudouridine55 synthase